MLQKTIIKSELYIYEFKLNSFRRKSFIDGYMQVCSIEQIFIILKHKKMWMRDVSSPKSGYTLKDSHTEALPG